MPSHDTRKRLPSPLLAALTAAPLAVFAAGCSGAAPGEDIGSTGSALSSNEETAYKYFVGKGLKDFQAAGIVGNLMQESSVDPTAVQYGGGPGRGIAQWSVGGRWNADSGDNVVAYASEHGESEWSLDLQLAFVWYELSTFSSYGLADLRASTNVTDATIAFQNDFEGCGTCDQSTRIAYAQNVWSLYGSDQVDGGVTSEDAGSGAPSCTVPNVGTGVCILTTECAALPGHMATPGYCPGPADEQCCTGPSNDGGAQVDSGEHGDSSDDASGSGSSSGSSSGGASGSSSGSQQAADGSMAASDTQWQQSSNGCAAARGGATGSSGYWLTGLAWIAIRRRRRPVRSDPLGCEQNGRWRASTAKDRVAGALDDLGAPCRRR